MEQKEIIERLSSLYITYRQRYVVMRPDHDPYVPKKKDGSNAPLTSRVLAGHVSHRYSVSIFAGTKTSKFICFDVDDGSPLSVRKVINSLASIGFPRGQIYVSSSGGKGYHVEIFFDDLVFTEDLRKIYRAVCRAEDLDTKKIEFRPTYTQAIKLPLSVHRKTGNVCWFLDQDTLSPICAADYLMSIQPVPASLAHEVATKLDEPTNAANAGSAANLTIAAAGEHLTAVGTRHEAMVRLAKECRHNWMSEEECGRYLCDWYHRQDKKLIRSSEKEVMDDISMICRWVYSKPVVSGDLSSPADAYTSEDACLVLAQTSAVRRKLMFLAVRAWKYYRCLQVSQEKLAELFGVTPLAVHNAETALAAAGYINLKYPKPKVSSSGNVCRSANKIYPRRPKDCPVNYKDLDVCADYYMPVLGLNSDWRQEYASLLLYFVKPTHLSKFLKPKELKEIKPYLGGNNYEHGTSECA